jgi:hypothetical protein
MLGSSVFSDKRTILAALMAVLFVVYCYGAINREPYPAPVFPGFGSIPVDDDIQPVRVRMLAFEAGDERELLTAQQAFNGAFDSFHPQMLNSLVAAGEGGVTADPELAAWSNERVNAELNWDCAEALEIVQVVPDGSEAEQLLARFEFEGCGQ